MRNCLMILIAGSVLCGCLSDGPSVMASDANSESLPGNGGNPPGNGGNPPGNSVPTISGNPPPAVLVSEFYDFMPAAADPDGDRLTFSISNKPSWANFDSSSGRIYGQPTLGSVGTFDNISISVSDGVSSAALQPFSVTVSQAALGSVTLSWAAPTQNADGSPLTDLAGYKIYYGKASENYDHEIRIDNPGTTTYTVENLVPGTYYFAATSFNASGVESAYSGEAVRTIS